MDNENEIKHIGVLGMRWGRSGGSKQSSLSNRDRSSMRTKSLTLVKQRNAVRSNRSATTMVADWLLSSNNQGKLFSEKHGKSSTAKKGAALSDQISTLRKGRDKTSKVLDAMMTPGGSSRKFSEMKPNERRAVTTITGIILAGTIGSMVINSKLR
jgi:hypothetical protein